MEAICVDYNNGQWQVNGKVFESYREALAYARKIADSLAEHHDRKVRVDVRP